MSDDRDLREAFARLRDSERETIPPFRITPPAPHFTPRLAFAALVLIVVIAGALFVVRRTREPRAVPQTEVTLSTWRAPTDFLLQTPGRELLSTTPRLQPQTPVINLSGGRS